MEVKEAGEEVREVGEGVRESEEGVRESEEGVRESEEGVREFKEVREVKAVCFAKYRRSSVPLDNTAQLGSLCAWLCRLLCKNYEFLIMNWTI